VRYHTQSDRSLSSIIACYRGTLNARSAQADRVQDSSGRRLSNTGGGIDGVEMVECRGMWRLGRGVGRI
jgi:hypothetical protein